jgi:hypothetical protein
MSDTSGGSGCFAAAAYVLFMSERDTANLNRASKKGSVPCIHMQYMSVSDCWPLLADCRRMYMVHNRIAAPQETSIPRYAPAIPQPVQVEVCSRLHVCMVSNMLRVGCALLCHTVQQAAPL